MEEKDDAMCFRVLRRSQSQRVWSVTLEFDMTQLDSDDGGGVQAQGTLPHASRRLVLMTQGVPATEVESDTESVIDSSRRWIRR